MSSNPAAQRAFPIESEVGASRDLDQEVAQLVERITAQEDQIATMTAAVTGFCQANPDVSLCIAIEH